MEFSKNGNTYFKEYDGLTITEGFADPIDIIEILSYFEALLRLNIYEPLEDEEQPILTVITCPRLPWDMIATLKILANQLYQIDTLD